jgi:tetratricopeptide (TPR) repeat protein
MVVTLTNIGQIYKIRGEYQNALHMYKEAIAIQRQFWEFTSDISSTSLHCLIHYQTRNYIKAIEVYQRPFVFAGTPTVTTLNVASTLNSIGLVLFKMELHELAMQNFLESLHPN